MGWGEPVWECFWRAAPRGGPPPCCLLALDTYLFSHLCVCLYVTVHVSGHKAPKGAEALDLELSWVVTPTVGVKNRPSPLKNACALNHSTISLALERLEK